MNTGAIINMKKNPRSAYEEAMIAFGGPAIGGAVHKHPLQDTAVMPLLLCPACCPGACGACCLCLLCPCCNSFC